MRGWWANNRKETVKDLAHQDQSLMAVEGEKGSPPQVKTANGPKLLHELIRDRKAKVSSAGVWQFMTTELRLC